MESVMEASILESIGVEMMGVMSPVSVCMLLVVLLVYSSSSPAASPMIRSAANLVYLESPSDPTWRKVEGGAVNAVVFVLLMTAVTFLLVVLYYYECTRFLKNYMRVSALVVLGSMGGSILVSLVQRFSIPVDAPSCLLLLLNFSVVGALSVLSPALPILLRQSYMVSLALILAAWLSSLPEWSTWSLLLALALYDLAAVLAPRGPLRILLDLASARGQDLPALVYEARPSPSSSNANANAIANANASASLELQPQPSRDHHSLDLDEESSPLVHSHTPPVLETRGIKLGLGDFVFYSVLVGRAAMYDLMTVYACYLAIISGLACTLILLSVCRRPLPALPISISLGILFYFLTRLLMEPFVVGAMTNLIMF